MIYLRLAVATLVVAIYVDGAAALPIHYSGPLNQVIGGFPGPSSTDVHLDGGDPKFVVEVASGVPSGNTGGMTVLRTPFQWAPAGNAVGQFKSFALGELFDPLTETYAVPAIHSPVVEPGFLLSGYDFGNGPPATPLGWLFNETEARDYYWAFQTVPDGTLGLVSGWMRVTVNPVVVDETNQQLSGGELILREWAYSLTGQEVLQVGIVPEPATLSLLALGGLSMMAWRRGRK